MCLVNGQSLRLIPLSGASGPGPTKGTETRVDCGEVEVRNGYLRVRREISSQLFKTGRVMVVGAVDAIEIFDFAVWQENVGAELGKLVQFISFEYGRVKR